MARRIRDGFQKETRCRARKWHLRPKAARIEEEGAREAGPSSYYLPGSGLDPAGRDSDETRGPCSLGTYVLVTRRESGRKT